jgi:CRP/FNR family cyclic AMP-dependent transcriptional regulator
VGHPHKAMQSASVRVLELEPDLARFLPAAQQEEAARLTVPVLHVEKGAFDVDVVLGHHRAFAAIVLDGMLLQRLRVGDQPGLRLLGPGDVVSLPGTQRTMLLAEFGCRVAASTRLALLGDEVLVATRRWPLLVPGLHTLAAAQSERLAAQLVICQLPRVDQRLLALMWLLAESWGHVTAVGTTLPLSLTHDVLGELVGARRSTVTLALGELSERGAIVRQDLGWLLLEDLPQPTRTLPEVEQPVLLADAAPLWAPSGARHSAMDLSHAELLETVARLREEHRDRVDRHQERLRRIASSRQRVRDARRALAREGVSRRRAPSS